MNVLAIGCHPDDLEINAGGTLAKCVKRGDKVTMVYYRNGVEKTATITLGKNAK